MYTFCPAAHQTPHSASACKTQSWFYQNKA
jgi:hypothetical protein